MQEAIDLGFLLVLELLVEFSEAWVAMLGWAGGWEGEAAPTRSGTCATTTLLHLARCWDGWIVDAETVQQA